MCFTTSFINHVMSNSFDGSCNFRINNCSLIVYEAFHCPLIVLTSAEVE